jgi:hypothetical protein
MTGCLGGDDGVAAALGTAFVIAIVASSGGTSAPVVFAANQKANIRTQISEANDQDKVSIQIIPLKDGVEQTGTTLSGSQVIWEDDSTVAGGKKLTAEKKIYIENGREYKIKVMYDGKEVLQGIKHIYPTSTSGEDTSINATSTAKVLIYEKWKDTASQDTYKSFEYNLGSKDISSVIDTVEGALSLDPTNPDYASATVTTSVNTTAGSVPANPVYSVSGYVRALSGAGLSSASVTIHGDNSISKNYTTTNGSFLFEAIPVGSYTVYVSKNDTYFDPHSKAVSITNADVTGITFQEQQDAHAASRR